MLRSYSTLLFWLGLMIVSSISAGGTGVLEVVPAWMT